MREHWNIQINIQHVTEVQTTNKSVGIVAAQPPSKEVTEILKLAITADSEVAAYEKAHRMLTANHLDTVVVRPVEEYPERPAVINPTRPIRDNPQA